MMAEYARENRRVKELTEAYRREHPSHHKHRQYGQHEELTEAQTQLKDREVVRILIEANEHRPLVFRRGR